MTHAFNHPGGMHTLGDLERMKTNVLAGNHPWIDGWNALITDSQAQSSYGPAPLADMGGNRQRADADAHAAYLNALRWYISGDTAYANAATNILNQWAATVNQVPSDTGLIGIPIMSFALAGETLRAYSGWQQSDFASFTNMMRTYLYPACTNYVWHQPCTYAHWTSWDARNNAAILAIGVLCDDTNLFNEAVNRYKGSVSTAAVSNAIPYRFGSLGQPSESGRDQEHCILGLADLGVLCQVAWNQGLDLYGYDNNRLLAGVEYLAQYNLIHDVPYTAMNNCAGENLWFVSNNGRGRLDDRPVYEMFYNHYVVRQGLSAPATKATAQLYRPERGSADHFGYGTLTYTLNAAAAPYPPAPLPAAPTALTATPGIGQITLNWTPPPGDVAFGYKVMRATTSGGPYATLAAWTANATASYTDTSVVNGSTYYYVVAAMNLVGTSAAATEISAAPAATSTLPAGWTNQDVAVVTSAGSAQYTGAGNNTFLLTGAGTGLGGTGDGGFNYTYRVVTNNFTIIARLTKNNANEMGLMMRGSLATNSAAVQFFMANNGRQSVYAVRTSNGGNLNHFNSGAQFTSLPAWYKLVRSGNVFTAYQSDDGINWLTVQSATISAIPTSGYYVGLAINSGNATFDHVVYTNAAVTGTFEPPVAPANLTATALTSDLVSLSWAAVTNASGYNVKRAIAVGGPYTNLVTDVTFTQIYDPSVTASTTYYYLVSAINGGGESTNSLPVSVTTPGASLPSAPVNLTAIAGLGQVALSWAASPGATSYNVKRGPNGGPYTNLATGVIAGWTDTNVTAGLTYYYVVSAVNTVGESANSSPASATPLNAVAIVEEFSYVSGALSGKNGGGGFGAAWNTAGSVVSPGLTNGTLVVAGNTASLANQNAFRPLSSGVDLTNPGTIWISVLARRTDADTQWGGFSLFSGTTTEKLFLGTIGGNYGFIAYATPGATQFKGPASSQGATTFLVCRLQSSGTNVTVNFYANPALGSQPPITPTDSATVGAFAYDTIRLGTGGNFRFDEIRTGISWASVVPLILPPAPTGLVATAGDAQVTLTWSAVSGATSYNVKSATTNGDAYSIIASNLTSLTFTNTGLANGTNYYFVVSTVNAAGESPNSVQVVARPVSSTPPQLVLEASGSQLQIAWPGDRTGWRLEAQTNALPTGLGTNWFTISGSANTNQIFVPITIGTGSVFFRLVYP